MSLAQQVAGLFLPELAADDPAPAADLGSEPWAGVVLGAGGSADPAAASTLALDAAALVRQAGDPAPLVGIQQAGGAASALPGLPPRAEPVVADSGSAAVAGAQATAAAIALRNLGFNLTLAPVADVDVPGGALSEQLYGQDPGLVARLSTAAVSAYRNAGMIPAPGHFPGAGAASADPSQMSATVGGSLAALRGRDLVPFYMLAARAPVIVMSGASYAAFDGVTPAELLPAAVQLLRRDLDFQGVIMTDDLDATLQPTGEEIGQVAVQAVNAGEDLLLLSGSAAERRQAYGAVLAAARSSRAVAAEVHEALLRVLTLKVRFGLLA